MAIEIICDGGGLYGVGHIRRSYSLAYALRDAAIPVKFTITSDTGKKYKKDFVSTDIKPALQIIDLPYEIQPWVNKAREKNIPIVALDYFGNAQPTLTISIYEHIKPLPEGRRVSGLEYAIIRSNIIKEKPTSIKGNIVIMIGGSDLNHVGESIALNLSAAVNKINLIQGPAIVEDYISESEKVFVHKSPVNLEAIMATCDWAVTNGGGSMMEMMSLGKAVYVVPQTNDELKLAKIVMEKGAILGIGMNSLSIPSELEIVKVGNRAKDLVDGQGANRIINLIKELL